MAGDEGPFEALIDEHVHQMARISHFGGKESLGMVGKVAVAAPCLPPRLFEDLDFFSKNGLRQKGAERVVRCEPQHVHARGTGTVLGSPPTGFADASIPVPRIPKMPPPSKLAYIVDERT